MSILVEARDNIYDLLEAEYPAVTMLKVWNPYVELENLGEDLHVAVIPMEQFLENASREDVEYQLRVDIAVFKKLAEDDRENEIDTLQATVQNVIDSITWNGPERRVFVGSGTESYKMFVTQIQNVIVLSGELYKNDQFMSLLTVQLKVLR